MTRGTHRFLSIQILTTAFIALAAILAVATPSLAQTPPDAQAPPAKAHAAAEKKKKPVTPTPAGATPSQASGDSGGHDAQNPLTPMWNILNENYTNFEMGPLHKTQNVLIVEPILPLKITPDWNLITRWNTPIVAMPRLAEPVGPFPGIGPEFGLGNMQPQFFFTPAHPGNFTFAVGPSLWLPTATDKTLGINKWGGGPVFVGLTTQGPLLVGFLAQNIWAGTTGTSQTLQRVNTSTFMPFVFYNLPQGWYLTTRPIITADWTVDSHNRWTVPIGGGFGRVIPVGNVVMDFSLAGYYNGMTPPAAGITNVGRWTVLFTLHFLFPGAPVPALPSAKEL